MEEMFSLKYGIAGICVMLTIMVLLKVGEFLWSLREKKDTLSETSIKNLTEAVKHLDARLEGFERSIADLPKFKMDMRRFYAAIKAIAGPDKWPGIREEIMKDDFNRAGPVLHLLLRYTQALITQMAQTAVCNRHHSLDQQLCRWLLLSLDRLQGNELVMTQELIANMLGVRREGVTEGALKLQQAGLIRYARGHISVLDRDGLENRSCECYAVVKKEYDRLLPQRSAT